ncbi:MAG: autotransporter-associated beta strand repeat-containing protein [Prevotella sp.]|nr:autotransporter-associated beta strand repeat-containing protein [Candidatus Equicola faecalis]
MKRIYVFMLFTLFISVCAMAQRIGMDHLGRGLVAVKTTSGVFCSWRIQGDEYYDVQYNLYRDGTKVNATPLNVSNYTDAGGSQSSNYTVRAVVKGVEQTACDAVGVMMQNYREIVPKHDKTLKATYVPNDACCADVDGDGELEILMKYDNSQEIAALFPKEGYQGEYTLLECLKQDGTVLWWVNCGPNMGDFQNNEQNIVGYDWDCDGRAEAVMRLCEGAVIHVADGKVFTVGGEGWTNYRIPKVEGGVEWFTYYGREYLLYVNGATGEPYQCIDYPLKRLENGETDLSAAWGDGYGHRCSKFFFGAPYLDGRHPSIFLARGIYTRHKMIAYDVDPQTHALSVRWQWTNNKAGSPWYGQGYHNYSIADVDWDGRDEIIFGSMVIDDNGKGLSTTGLGHGDAHHVADLDPYRKGQEFFACNEAAPDNNFRDATTSKIYFRETSTKDDARAIAGNFSDSWPGAQAVSSHSTGVIGLSADANVATNKNDIQQNFRIYWDGDLLEETFNGMGTRNSAGGIWKYGAGQIATLTGSLTNNDTKATPCFQGDVTGDWREEIIMRTAANNIRIYTTTTPTSWRNYSLWYDHQYRNAMVWQMCGYNQPPHTSYFLGQLENITIAPPPLTMQGRTEVMDGGTISGTGGDIILCQMKDATVNVSDGTSPHVMVVNTPSWVQGNAPSEATTKDFPISTTYMKHTLTGGAFTGAMRLVKQGDGELTLPAVNETYTGPTEVWAGVLNFDGQMPSSRLWLNRFAILNTSATYGKTIEMNYASELRPGGVDKKGTVSVDSLIMGFGSRLVLDIFSENTDADLLKANVLKIERKGWKMGPKYLTPVLEFHAHGIGGSKKIASGKYLIAEVAKIDGDVNDLIVENIPLAKYSLSYEDGKLYLNIEALRDAADVVWSGAVNNVWNTADAKNFLLDGKENYFVPSDRVTFDDTANNTSVQVQGAVYPASVVFNNNTKTYTIGGDSIIGDASVTFNGAGTVNMNNTNHYTGGTFINGGTVAPSSLASATGSEFGAFGRYNTPLQMSHKATLTTSVAMTASHPITLSNGGATFDVTKNTLTIDGGITKTGEANIYKTGGGTLQLSCTNNFDTLFISKGEVYDYGDNHFNNKTVVFNGGTLRYNNSINSYSSDNVKFVVPEGQTGALYLDGRCDYSGTLTGAGSLDVTTTFVRCPLQGNWSEFSGTIKAIQGPKATYDPTFDFNNTYGIGKATLNIQSGCTVYTNGKNFAIGALTGSGNIRNDGNWGSSVNTLTIGGKNEDFTFSGQIVKSNITKTGMGIWTVSDEKVLAEAGQVTINEGSLKLNKPTALATMTGSKTLYVDGGATICGRGTVNSLCLHDGAVYRPGVNIAETSWTLNIGTIKALGDISVETGAQVYLNKTSKNPTSSKGIVQYSYMEAGGTLTLNGTIHVIYKTSGWTPAIGDEMILFVASSIVGNPTFDLQALPEGLAWDLSTVMQDGKIRVVSVTAVKGLRNDEKVNCEVFTLNGIKVADLHSVTLDGVQTELRMRGLVNGSYILRLVGCEAVETKKITLR